MSEPEQRREADPTLRAIDYVGHRSLLTLRAWTLLMVLLFGVLDYLTGPEVSFSILYLLPVSLAAWHVGCGTGLLLAALSAGIGLSADLLGPSPDSGVLVAFWNAGAHFGVLAVLTWILSALRTSLDREKILARTDPLTGLLNRRAFYADARREIDRARRYGRPLSVIYLDVDQFKKMNDRFGHRTGDTLLRALAQTARRSVRTTDILARLGGDEFAVLLVEADVEPAQTMVTRLAENIAATMRRNGWPVTVSAGVVTFRRPPSDVDDMMLRADAQMYEAKKDPESPVRHDVVEV